jgi:hypothetical protein
MPVSVPEVVEVNEIVVDERIEQVVEGSNVLLPLFAAEGRTPVDERNVRVVRDDEKAGADEEIELLEVPLPFLEGPSV